MAEDNNLDSPNIPQPPAPADNSIKDDWFKSELAGLNNNLADLYHSGVSPDSQMMDKLDDYWANETIKKPFIDTYGDKAKEEFTKVYNGSKEKLDAYKNHYFDVTATSFPVVPFRTRTTERLEQQGKLKISSAPSEEFVKLPKYADPWGRTVTDYNLTTGTVGLSEPKFGWREGAKKVYDEETDSFLDMDKFLEKNPGTNFVYAANEDGSPKVGPDNLAYLRPLKYGEDKKTYEQYYTDTADIMGSKGLYRSDWYALQWLPKNTMNFIADASDSALELMKLVDNLWQTGDQSSWDRALTEGQNDIASVLQVPTSEEGMEHWYTAEGLADGMAQIGFQVFGMKGIGYGAKTLATLAKMGKGQRAGQIASQLWMATFVSDEIAKEGRENGLSPKEIMAAYTGYAALMYNIAGLSEKIIDPIATKSAQKEAIKSFTKELKIAKDVSKGTLGIPNIYLAAKNAVNKVDDILTSALTSESKVLRVAGAAGTEALEEDAELFGDKVFKETYNALYGGPFAGDDDFKKLNDPNKDARFRVSWTELPSELAASTVLGAAGGGLFKAMDVFNNNGPIKRNTIISYGATQEGYAPLRRQLEKMHKADQLLPGGRNVDIFGQATTDASKSRSNIVYQALKNEIDMAEGIWKAYNADKSFTRNQEELDRLNANYKRVTGEDADLRNTSLASDMTRILSDITKLKGEILSTDSGITPDQITEKSNEILKLETELKDITSGKNALTYLHESLYNKNPKVGYASYINDEGPDHRLEFKEFNKVNNYFKSRSQEIQSLKTTVDNQTLQEMSDAKVKISRNSDVYRNLESDIESKYSLDEGIIDYGNPQYQAEKALLDSLVYNKSANALDDFEYSILEDGSTGVSFDESIKQFEKQEELSRETGSIIFDDDVALNKLKGQLSKRASQLYAMSIVNPETNAVISPDGREFVQPEISTEDALQVAAKLDGYLARVMHLFNIASNNKRDFFKSANQSANTQMQFTAKQLVKIADIIKEQGYSDLAESLQNDLAGLVASQTKNDFEIYHSKVTTAIHVYFKSFPNEAIKKFYDAENEPKNYNNVNDYSYLRAIISLSPSEFKSYYSTALTQMSEYKDKEKEEDLRTPFPAQDRNIYRAAAFLTRRVSPALEGVEQWNVDNAGKDYTYFTESFFLQDEQGSGKTIVALMAAKIAQLQPKMPNSKPGGKVAIFAKQNAIRNKDTEEAINKIKLDVDNKTIGNGNWEANDILQYLDNKKNLEDIAYIIIDEATLYTASELQAIDTKVREINRLNFSSDGRPAIKILLVGDPSQTGAMHPNPPANIPQEYNIGQPSHTIERSEVTAFSWRTGNMDILDALRQLRTLASRNISLLSISGQFSEITVKYDKLNKEGYYSSKNFLEDTKAMIANPDIKQSDYFVITTKEETKQALVAAKVPVENILTPAQAQGQERKFVFVDCPVNPESIGQDLQTQYKAVLTAVGRASQMVIIKDDPALKIVSIEGKSEHKTAAFTPEQLAQLRNERMEALAAAGVVNAEGTAVPLGEAPTVMPTIVNTITEEEKPISSNDADELLNLITNIKPKSGDKAIIATFYTYGTKTNEDGTQQEIDASEVLRIKNQLTSTDTIPYDADRVNFVLQYQRNEPPTRVADTYSDLGNQSVQSEPKLVLYARLMKNEEEVAKVAFGALSGINKVNLPLDKDGNRVFAVNYTAEQSAEILTELKKNRKDASVNTKDAFAESREKERTAEQKKLNNQKTNLVDFKKKNTSHNYASGIWHVTLKNTQRAPWLFYSYHLTTEEIDRRLEKEQSVLMALLEEGSKENISVINKSREKLKKMGILSLPLDDGKTQPVLEFLENNYNEYAVPKDYKKTELGEASRSNIKQFVTTELKLEGLRTERKGTKNNVPIIDEVAYAKLEKKSFGADKYSHYLSGLVKESTRLFNPGTKPEKESVNTKSDNKDKTKKKGVKISPVQRRFQPLTFLKLLYEDLQNPEKSANAQLVLDKLSSSIFKNGVYISAATIPTGNPGSIFGLSDLQDSEVTVAGYLSPANPIFQIPMSLLNNADTKQANEIAIIKHSTVVTPDVAKPEVVIIQNDVPKDGDPELLRFMDDTEPKKGDGKIKTIFDISQTWFKGKNGDYFGEFGNYFRYKIYNSVFPLNNETPVGIVTSDNINQNISGLKNELQKTSKEIIDDINEESKNKITYNRFVNTYLSASSNVSQNSAAGFDIHRQVYYDMVIANEFDSLLTHYMPSIKSINGEYVFAKTNFKYNPIADSKDEVSHLATGSEIAKMHLFNTPLIEKSKDGYITRRTLNTEDYALIIRDMKDNDITSFDKALAYFNSSVENSNLPSRIQRVKFSIYQRFLAENSIELGGKKHHSIMSAVINSKAAVSEEEKFRQLKLANNSVTALLSFLASGNEAEYVRVIFNNDDTFSTTGRISSLYPSMYRADLEGGIAAVKDLQKMREEQGDTKNKPLVKYDKAQQSATFTFKNRRSEAVVKIFTRGSGAGVGFGIVDKSGSKEVAVSPELRAKLLNELGLGGINTRSVGQIKDFTFASVLLKVAEYIDSSEEKTFNEVLGPDLTDWVSFAELHQELNSAESAYGYRLLNGERVNLLSLSYPFVRVNQKLKELDKYEGESPLKSLDISRHAKTPTNTSHMKIVGYALKEGFTDEDGSYSKHNSQLTWQEQFKYDYHHLYLGMLARNAESGNRTSPTAMFSPITLSDKGSAVITKTSANFLLDDRRNKGRVDIEAIETRTINAINDYYRNLGVSIHQAWKTALLGLPTPIILPTTPVVSDPASILQALEDINVVIASLNDTQKQQLLAKGELVENLHYTPTAGSIGLIKQSIFDNINPVELERRLRQDYLNFLTQARAAGITEQNTPYLDTLKLTEEEALKTYFWNWNWTSFNFTTMTLGVEEQYKSKDSYTDMIKRASQISTNRGRAILKDENAPTKPVTLMDKLTARKLPRYSNVAVIRDFKKTILPVSYTRAIPQKIYDGASFFNNFAKIQMKESYGGAQGTNVGANLKPISTDMDFRTGAARYDKYASFEITQQMVEGGDDFIVALDKLMKHTIKFPGVNMNGKLVHSVYELEQEGIKAGMTTEQIFDFMVEQGVQDMYIREITFDSSVKTGAKNVNNFNSTEELVAADALSYTERDNSEWGLVLDASGESDGAYATFASQFVSLLIQTPDTVVEGGNILKAISLIGERARGTMFDTDVVTKLQDAINSRTDIGMVNQIVNQEGGPSLSNKMMLNMGYSALASELSDSSIRFKIFGGQQPLAPATGVWRVVEEDGKPRIANKKDRENFGNQFNENTRELNGFDAVRVGINGKESIKKHPTWLALQAAVDAGNKLEANQLRKLLYQELKEGNWTVQPVEAVVSPIHFSRFGIPSGAKLEDITVEFFINQDKERRLNRFSLRDIKDEATKNEYTKARNEKDSDKMSEIANRVIDADINPESPVYQKKFDDFQKSLQMLIGRIPATTMHSLTPIKVVGFSHGSDNTFYAHPDLLVFHGADQDIDKGNIMAFEPENGEIQIPELVDGKWYINGELVEESSLTDVQLKNFIVQEMLNAYSKAETAIVATMPTSTDNIDEALKDIPEQNSMQSRSNPITNNEMFERGQGGKSNTGIGANGLKVYSNMVFSSNKNGRQYDYYVPVSSTLSLDGRAASISTTLDSLTTYDEVIQAAVDNAKDPKLGRASINQFNGSLVSALALHGYSPKQIIDFVRNPIVQKAYDTYKNQRNFGYKGKRETIVEILKDAKDNHSQDLRYFAGFAEQMDTLAKVLKINQEIPNDIFSGFALKDAFKKLTENTRMIPVTLEEFVNKSLEERQAIARDFTKYQDVESPFNVYEILNDNQHMFSYLKSFVQIDSYFQQRSAIYNDIVKASEAINRINEKALNTKDKFNAFVDFTYGLAIDKYLNNLGDGSVIVMNDVTYDLRKIANDETDVKGRLAFMKDFPNYFTSLDNKDSASDSLQDTLRQYKYGEVTVIKPYLSIKSYPVEKKIKLKEKIRTINKDFYIPKGDTLPSSLIQFYSLIKDKGGVSGTSFTELFDYEGSHFQIFDNFIQNNPLLLTSEYFRADNAQDLELMFRMAALNSGISEEEKEDNPDILQKRKSMRKNKLFIPYTNDITQNDLVSSDSLDENISASSNGLTADDGLIVRASDGTMMAVYKVKSYEASLKAKKEKSKSKSKSKTKSQKIFQTDISRRMAGYNVSSKMVGSFAAKLGRALGIEVRVMSSKDMINEGNYPREYVNRRGFVANGVVVINSDFATVDTPIHEFTHLWLEGLKSQNPEMYSKIITESLNHPMADTIREKYPEEDEEGIAEEVFATLSGIYNAKKAHSKMNTGFFQRLKSLFDDFVNWVNKTFSNIFGVGITVKDSLAGIIDQVGESMISAMDLSASDASDLKLLGIRLVSADSQLSALRERMKVLNRYEKIC